MTRQHRSAIVVGALSLVNACAHRGGRDGPVIQERAWPVYLGRASRTGSAETLATNPQAVWRTSVARGITGAPALAENVVAVSTADNRVALLDRPTGDLLWTRRLSAALGAGPLLSDDRLFVAEQVDGGRVYALRLRDGTTIWSVRAGQFLAPLALGDSALYGASAGGGVLRIHARTGAVVWRARVSGAVRAAPVLLPGGLLVATQSDSLFLLDAATGAIRVRRPTRGTVLAAPAYADSLLVIGTSAGRLEALDPATLVTRWRLDLGDVIVGSVAVRDGRAYALTGRGLLVAVPPGNPAAARRFPLQLVARAGPAPAAQGIFISSVTGEIVLVDSAGNRAWSARIVPPVNEPVLVDERTLVAVSLRGDVVMFR